MPLAVVKMTGVQLPYIDYLNHSNALNPNLKLSSVKGVVVFARVSKAGDLQEIIK